MQPASLYGHTIEAFAIFRTTPAIPADGILRRFFTERKYLGAKDRRFISAAYFGVIRNWMRLEAVVLDSFQDQMVTAERTVAAFAIVIRGDSPETAQDLLSRFDFPIDGLKRMADPQREAQRLNALEWNERLAVLHSFPTWFVTRIAEEYGADRTEAILTSLNGGAPTAIRTNTVLTSREELQEELAGEGCETALSQVAQDALILTNRTNVFDSAAFRRGAFEVQDEGSQLIAPFARILKMSSKVLECLRGRGRKSTPFFFSSSESWRNICNGCRAQKARGVTGTRATQRCPKYSHRTARTKANHARPGKNGVVRCRPHRCSVYGNWHPAKKSGN